MKLGFALALALAPLAGCASETAQAKPAPTAATKASTPSGADPKAVCVATMTKARECTDDYIPALVDARAQADVPPGIADEVKKDRDGVIKEAMGEWKTDSQDANIAAMCDKMATDPSVPAEDITAAKDCNAKACKEFTSCVMPLFAKHFRK
jgi:outer membrane murein-binding lipoprotein Lpp